MSGIEKVAHEREKNYTHVSGYRKTLDTERGPNRWLQTDDVPMAEGGALVSQCTMAIMTGVWMNIKVPSL